jgi:D-3-phosphoglycerate dehydrogenase
MRFLVIDKVHSVLMERLQIAGHSCDYAPDISPKAVAEVLKNYDGLILRSKIKVNKNFIDTQPQLKIIGRVGSGMENIDVEYAQSRGIICLNSPEGNRDAVAEHAVGLMLGLLHNICKSNTEVKNGQWLREQNRGQELGGKIIGIIGYGNTGSATAQRLLSFNVTILAYDKYKTGFGNDQILEVSL